MLVQVSDFNLSRIVEDSLVASSMAASNPRWLAPEVLTGKGATFASVRRSACWTACLLACLLAVD